MKKKNVKVQNNLVMYQTKSGAIELRGDVQKETIRATQAQISKLFGVERSVITKHIRNIFSSQELVESSVCAKFAHTGNDGKTYQVQFYNLDLVLSVGYRVNSKTATLFRQWATKTLRRICFYLVFAKEWCEGCEKYQSLRTYGFDCSHC